MSERFSRDGGPIRGGRRYDSERSAANIVSYEFGRLRQLLPRVISRCMAFSSMTRFDDDLVSAVREFYGLDVDVATAETDILDDEVERVRFYPWFLWDWRSVPGGPSIGDQFLTESDCDKHERRLVEALCKSYVSFYEALEDATHRGVTVRDLASGELISVTDEGLAGDLFEGQLLQARLVRVAGDEAPLVLVDAVYACLPAEALATVEAEIQSLVELEILDKTDPGAIADSLKGCVSECLHFADHLLEALAQPPEACNREGDPLALCRATLAPEQERRLLQILEEGCEGLIKLPEGLWQFRQHGRVTAFIHVGEGDKIMLGANSLGRLDQLQEFLAERFELSISRLRSVSEFNIAVRRWAEHGGGQPWLRGDPEIGEAVRHWLEFWVRNWADIPSPILDGRTPREAVYESQGRDRVERALQRFEKLKFGGLGTDLSKNLKKLRLELGL